ncbi:NUDIX domain-containing protein [Marinitenerispora sediminis]|uniref:NUDIX hydrolase n=1 Tax=Marinitenerispora sediminis TaxID=1931232 RepID=A0A368SYG8_9ACTN|nr:NUDIX domain-containing protein [Marinitenerispora sediminis]RCV49263.1 NUDIX hydrolase [Marinitenerispora sediminis]RCV51456.1 NUDIX hydrolase [Marinitenerispora sediminis]RCV55238.1 NUDIX hydrolase [Marinitenerispora sediminis]
MHPDVRVAAGVDLPRTGGATWVVGAVVLDDRGRAFAQRRSPGRRLFPDCWDIVGGHVEPGETVLDALVREIREETGWRLTEVLADLGRLVWTPEDGIERHEVDYLVRVSGDLSAPALEPEKHTAFVWATEADLPMLTVPGDPGASFVADTVGRGLRRARELAG